MSGRHGSCFVKDAVFVCAESIPKSTSDGNLSDGQPPAKATRSKRGAAASAHASKEEQEFGSTLQDFGYEFDSDGVLRGEKGEGFVFNVRKNQAYNQRRYEALGKVITEEVYNRLEEDCSLEKIFVPKGEFLTNLIVSQIMQPVSTVRLFWFSQHIEL